jgi:hypothetical protein
VVENLALNIPSMNPNPNAQAGGSSSSSSSSSSAQLGQLQLGGDIHDLKIGSV